MPTEAETRRRKKQDATRKRYALWLTFKEARALDKVMRNEGLPSRIAVIRTFIRNYDIVYWRDGRGIE